LASLCSAAGLEWPAEKGQLLERVKDLSRVSVAVSGLSVFAGEVCDTLAVKVLGLGEVQYSVGGATDDYDSEVCGSVRYVPLAKLGAAVRAGERGGPAFVGLSQASAILNVALDELSMLRRLQGVKG